MSETTPITSAAPEPRIPRIDRARFEARRGGSFRCRRRRRRSIRARVSRSVRPKGRASRHRHCMSKAAQLPSRRVATCKRTPGSSASDGPVERRVSIRPQGSHWKGQFLRLSPGRRRPLGLPSAEFGAARGRPLGVPGDQPRQRLGLFEIWKMAGAPDDLEPAALDELGGLLHQCDRGRAVFIADQAQGLNRDRAGVGPQVGALQRPAGGEIALLRRSRQHRPPASQFVGAAGPKVGGEPSLENGVGDRLDAPFFDLRDSRVPGLRRFRSWPPCRRARARRPRGVAGDRVPGR